MSSTGDVEVLLKVLGDSSNAQQSIRDFSAATQRYTQDVAVVLLASSLRRAATCRRRPRMAT
jgi:hypothetical protein